MVAICNGKERFMLRFAAKVFLCAPLACALILSSATIATMVGVFVVVAVFAVVAIIIRRNFLPGRAG